MLFCGLCLTFKMSVHGIKFCFPILIIVEVYRFEHTSGLGIRALAQAIEREGMEVLGVTSYDDLSQFRNSKAGLMRLFLSIDAQEIVPASVEAREINETQSEVDAIINLRVFIGLDK